MLLLLFIALNIMNNLDNSYTLWLHNVFDNDWSINGYKKIYTFNTLEKGISLINNIPNELIEKSMLFLMKNDIKPIWEDKENYNGGCFSYKIINSYVASVWKIMSYRLIGNTINDDINIIKNITGISISPKKTYCIIKIWISNIDEKILNNNIFNEFINKQLNQENSNQENLNKERLNEEKMINDPFHINNLCNIEEQYCIFRKHNVLY